MLKGYRFIRKMAAQIEKATDDVASRIIGLHDTPAAREEEITSQMRSEITLHLLEAVKEQLNGKFINGLFFDVYTYTKKQEHVVGADLAGIISMTVDDITITKGYLAQAKVAKAAYRDDKNKLHARVYDPRLSDQTQKMLDISSSSVVFIYSKYGVHVVPATATKLWNRNRVDTTKQYYMSLGEYYSEMYRSFVGDTNLAKVYTNPKELELVAERTRAANVLLIQASNSGSGTAI